MTIIVMTAVILGILTGISGLLFPVINHVESITTLALCLLLLSVGIDLGRNRESFLNLKGLGWKMILVPLGIALGSIGGAACAGLIMYMPLNEAAAIGAGFGWYSLSGVILTRIYNVETGTMAFLSNVFRELTAILLMPLIAQRWRGFAVFAPGGATTMDTTLPLINKISGPDVALAAFISGLVLSALVPLLVPILINI